MKKHIDIIFEILVCDLKKVSHDFFGRFHWFVHSGAFHTRHWRIYGKEFTKLSISFHNLLIKMKKKNLKLKYLLIHFCSLTLSSSLVALREYCNCFYYFLKMNFSAHIIAGNVL